MENSGGIKASLQGRYASALYDLAHESKTIAQIESDLASLRSAIDVSPEMAALIRDPQIGRKAAGSAVQAIGKHLGLTGMTLNFLAVLAQGGRLAVLPEVITAFTAIASAARGEITAEVTSAHPLDAKQISALTAKLAAREGQSVTVKTKVDPEILGGLIVKIGSQQIDSSIRTRLNSLAQAMKGQSV